MRYLLGLLLLISVSASAQYSPTAAKTRFVNGIGLGTKDTSTMNAADTVAMIVGRDSLVYFRYKGYWKPLAYNSSLTGYVPYTGATSSVNLGSYNLTATKIAIGGSISAVSLDVHRAGSIVARIENTNASQDALFAYAQSAQNVWFTGIDYSSGANNFGFYYTPDGTTVLRKAYFSNAGDLTANSFIKSGGTSSQFLKADGSITTTIPSGSIDTGRSVTAIATGGSLNKVRDSLAALDALKISGSGTTNYIPKFTSSSAIGNSNLINDASGNLGLGVTPSAWASIFRTEQIGNNGGFLASRTDGINQIQFGVNAYYDGTNWIYTTNEYASRYYQANGVHSWSNAPSGTAGNTITFTQAMTLTASGSLGIGTSSPSYLLDVNGTGRFSNLLTTAYANTGSSMGQFIINTAGSTLNNSSDIWFGTWGGSTISGITNARISALNINAVNAATDLLFYTWNGSSSGERLRITSTGASSFSSRVNVNGATDNASYQLNVIGQGQFTGLIQSSAPTSNSFGGGGNFYGPSGYWNIRTGTANDFNIDVFNSGAPVNALKIIQTGAATFSSLAGTGSRIVVADASGTLSATTAAATSGTYTPTITLVTNAASSTARVCQYMRVGSVVTVSGYVTVTATTPAASSRIYMSLPISSSFTSTAQAGGAGGVPGGANIGTVIFANSTATTVSMDFVPTAGALDYWFTYTYQIL
jgi:hypothetical protein